MDIVDLFSFDYNDAYILLILRRVIENRYRGELDFLRSYIDAILRTDVTVES